MTTVHIDFLCTNHHAPRDMPETGRYNVKKIFETECGNPLDFGKTGESNKS